jgi:hypothetical protein
VSGASPDLRLRYGRLRPLFTVLGAGPGVSHVRLDDRALDVRMGWVFHTSIPRASIRDARVETRPIWWAIGVHWAGAGTWLVNGAAGGVVWLELAAPAQARTLGIRLTLRRLGISLEHPDALVTALGFNPRDRRDEPR